MKKDLARVVAALAVVSTLFLLPLPASAGWFSRHHPRRAEVNHREQNQQERIANGIQTGRLNPTEAARLENEESALKRQERQDVRANGGYLTKHQQRQLNQEENGLSHEIYQDMHN